MNFPDVEEGRLNTSPSDGWSSIRTVQLNRQWTVFVNSNS